MAHTTSAESGKLLFQHWDRSREGVDGVHSNMETNPAGFYITDIGMNRALHNREKHWYYYCNGIDHNTYWNAVQKKMAVQPSCARVAAHVFSRYW